MRRWILVSAALALAGVLAADVDACGRGRLLGGRFRHRAPSCSAPGGGCSGASCPVPPSVAASGEWRAVSRQLSTHHSPLATPVYAQAGNGWTQVGWLLPDGTIRNLAAPATAAGER
jgi:hypothetical protein